MLYTKNDLLMPRFKFCHGGETRGERAGKQGDADVSATTDDTPASLLPQLLPQATDSTAIMLLLDYQNVLIESLLKDRFNG